jgi:hypothetical protein
LQVRKPEVLYRGSYIPKRVASLIPVGLAVGQFPDANAVKHNNNYSFHIFTILAGVQKVAIHILSFF